MKLLCAALCLMSLCHPLSGQVLLKEDFSKKSRFAEDSMAYYHKGTYHVYSYNTVTKYDTTKKYKNFTAEIRTEFISGDTTSDYGLLFRHDGHVNGYSFIITAQGHYYLQRSYLKPGGGVGDVEVKSIVYGFADSNFNRKKVNYLKVECNGNIIKLFINGHRVDSVADSTLREGMIGFRAQKGMHVHFDDLTVNRKNIPRKYSFKPVIPDSTFDEKNDSLTYNLHNFNKYKIWNDNPRSFYEDGMYKIDSSAIINSYISCDDENFSFITNFRIHSWRKSGALHISWYDKSSLEETEIGIIGDSSMQYTNRRSGSKSMIQNFPFQYYPNTTVRIKIDKKDSDVKMTVNGIERVLIIDESYESIKNEWIIFKTSLIGIDIFSFKVSKLTDEEYGLAPKDKTCPVIRVSGNNDTGRKPALGDDSDKMPVEDSSLKNLFLTIIILGATQILLIWGIVKWRNATRYNSTHFLDYIREKNGSFYLNEFIARFRMSRKKAVDAMEKMVRDYAGYRYPVNDENDAFYDFPTFMSDVPNAVTVRSYPDFIENMIASYAKRIELPESTARFYFIQICTLAAHLQGRLSVHTVNKKIGEGSFILDRAHFSLYKTTWDIVILLMSQIIDDERYIKLLSEDAPTVLTFHEDLCKHFK